MTNTIFSNTTLETTRIESKMATAIRLAQYPDGTQKLQGAYAWTQGFEGGVVWRMLPIVMVDNDGNEFTED